MKVKSAGQQIKAAEYLNACFDVSKDTLNVVAQAHSTIYEDQFANRTRTIEPKLDELHAIAKSHGLKGLRVVCEPTGVYDRCLLRTARRLGHRTAYVNAEAVKKFRVIETNDSGKTDLKDPYVISSLANLGKTITHRLLDENYLVLRRLSKLFDDAYEDAKAAKIRILDCLQELFCDLSLKSELLFSKSGRAFLTSYGGSPFKIVRSGRKRFQTRLRKVAPGTKSTTIEKIWEAAVTSARNEIPAAYAELLEHQVLSLLEALEQAERRRQDLETRLEEFYWRAAKEDPAIPRPHKGVVTVVNLARLLGETGPLSDFENHKKLLRHAGLNIRMNQSGRFSGQNRITKKGRPLLRKLLGQMVFGLVQKHRLLGEYYHKKKKAIGTGKAMTATTRLFLKKLYGWYRSGEDFSHERFNTCENQLHRTVA